MFKTFFVSLAGSIVAWLIVFAFPGIRAWFAETENVLLVIIFMAGLILIAIGGAIFLLWRGFQGAFEEFHDEQIILRTQNAALERLERAVERHDRVLERLENRR